LTLSCSKENIPDINESQLSVLMEDANEALILEEILDEVMEDLEQYEYLKSSDVCPVRTFKTPEEGKDHYYHQGTMVPGRICKDNYFQELYAWEYTYRGDKKD